MCVHEKVISHTNPVNYGVCVRISSLSQTKFTQVEFTRMPDNVTFAYMIRQYMLLCVSHLSWLQSSVVHFFRFDKARVLTIWSKWNENIAKHCLVNRKKIKRSRIFRTKWCMFPYSNCVIWRQNGFHKQNKMLQLKAKNVFVLFTQKKIVHCDRPAVSDLI